jgi:hypothetical protein
MLAGSLIFAISVLLFAYWFRYTCKLMLSVRPAQDLTGRIAEANKLKFRKVQSQLNGETVLEPADLDILFDTLNRDHEVINYLMKHAARYRADGEGVEHMLLEMDYWLMMAIYWVTRNNYRNPARKALREMARVLNYFTNSMGASLNGEGFHAAIPE